MKTLSNFILLIAGIIIGGMLGISACKQGGEKQQEKTLEKAIEQGSGKKADVNIEDQNITIESEGSKMEIKTGAQKWPSDAPGEVPELQAGQIIGTTRSESEQGKNWSIRYSGVAITELDNYAAILKNRGFKIQKVKAPKGGMVNGEKSNIGVIFTVAPEISVLAIVEQKE